MYKFVVLFLVFSESIRGLVIKDEREIGHLGIVDPELCGFPENLGTFFKLEVTTCSTQPCAMSPNYDYEIATSFIPAKQTNTLELSVIFRPTIGSGVYLSQNVRIPGTFSAGNRYRIIQQVHIKESMAENKGVIEILLTDSVVSGHFVHRCFEVTISKTF